MNLNTFLNPKSIAVIGASRNKKKLGYQILNNIKTGGFKGAIYPVNLEVNKINGLRAYKSIKNIKAKVDLAIIVIPAKFVAGEVKNCALAGVKNIIIISAGFSEVGKAGEKIETEIKKLADENRLNVLGPNCLGMVNGINNINATFSKAEIKKGNIAFVLQSGAIGSAIFDWIQDKNIGLSYFVSLGNKTAMDENDFFKFFIKNKETELIVAYLEEIKEGQKFMEVVSRLSRVKPVAVLKVGQTEAGRQAALSHTGSLAGSQEAVIAGLKRSGVIILETLEELFILTKFCQRKAKIRDSKVHIISNAGGPMVAVTDDLSRQGLVLGKFSVNLIKKLEKQLPELTTVKNPLDILGDANAERYKEALETILANKKIGNLLILLTPQSATEIEKTARVIIDLSEKYSNKLICTSFIGGQSLKKAKKILEESSVVDFDYPHQAIKCLSQFLEYGENLKSLKPYQGTRPVLAKTLAGKNQKFQQGTGQAIDRGREKGRQKDYLESLELLDNYGIKTARTFLVKGKHHLAHLKYPIAIKIVGPKIIHKTDKSYLVLDIENKKEAENFFRHFKKVLKGDNYCVAQEMIIDGLEMIIGFKRDKSFGPIIMVGLGGIYTEIFKDIQAEVDDINESRALEMIKKLKIYPILAGARGQGGFDIESLAKTIVRVARLSREHLEIQELDINPLFVKKQGVIAADARIIL